MVKQKMIHIFILLVLLTGATSSFSFCGFYVSRADTSLYNEASQVVLARDGSRTAITMASDYKGDIADFAIVIPVPKVPKKSQIQVINRSSLTHLDAYTAPRLVEYFDKDPCKKLIMYEMMARSMSPIMNVNSKSSAKSLGVKIEAKYTVGEYDIIILSAKKSNGLLTWLKQNGYKLPKGADKVVNSYIKQDMKFFVAKVNLKEQQKSGFKYLRPIKVYYESRKFMVPIRLGTLNAKGKQELFIYALSPKGRIETTNYRTVKLPSNINIPSYIKDDFADFYRKMFAHQVKKENEKAVFLEYAWDMNWCDPCAADPLTDDELRELGVFWLGKKINNKPTAAVNMPMITRPRPQKKNVYVTRLHLSYDSKNFPEDLLFQTTSNRKNFQGRYIMNQPWQPKDKDKEICQQARNYLEIELPKRLDKDAQNLANLTGEDINEIRKKIKYPIKKLPPPKDIDSWWMF